MCQKDNHFIALVRYVERNAKRAGLVKKAEDWKWSSIWRREAGSNKQSKFLSPWPVSITKNYLKYLNEAQSEDELEIIRKSINKNVPFGNDAWCAKMIDKFQLRQTLRGVGRPKKENGG